MKTDPTTLDAAYAYLKTAIPNAPYPTTDGMKTFLTEFGRTHPEVLKADPASFVDTSIIKALDDEGFIKRIAQRGP